MTRVDLYNGGGLTAAICATLLGAAFVPAPGRDRVEQVAPRAAPLALVSLPDGTRGVRDASGAIAPLARYTRIASASLIADHVLWELCEPERWIAVSQRSKQSAHFAHRHRERAVIASPADLEPILALAPDLLFIDHFGDPRYAARLREHGIAVFDLGEMRGLSTLLPNIRVIGALIGAPSRAEALIATLHRRLQAVAADVPAHARPSGLYLSTYGKQLYAGGADTSYDDVLRHAGLENAASAHRGWPAFDPEQVLALDPDVLVTKRGMAAELCAFPGLQALRACRGRARIAELDPELIDDPGPPMLDMAEALRELVHGRSAALAGRRGAQ